MNIFSLNWKQIKAKPLSSILNIFLFATGVAIISFLFLTTEKIENQLNNNVAGIDLVVGAKGSPLQLILAGIYHIDHPTGNIQYDEALALTKNPLVKQAIPLALGDSYRGFRIVGTNHIYPDIYHGQLKEGLLWKTDFEATIGAKVAEKGQLKVGDSFAGVHGFIEEAGHAHDEHTYTVTGIFEETGTVLDQLILTNMESVWEIHAHHHDDHSDEQKEITLLLIKYTNPMGAITLPRLVNSSTNMQAASPALEINRLYSLMGVGVYTIRLIAGFIIILSAFSIFISLLNSLKERKYALALIRSLGGRRNKLFFLVILEGTTIAFAGYLVGFILSRIGMLLVSYYAENNYHYNLAQWFNLNDLYFLFVSLIIGLLSAIVPAIKATRTDISKTLSE